MTETADRHVDILLVEDNPGDARLAKEAFRDADLGATLHAVTDGEQALAFVYRRGEFTDAPRPDVVFLDWNLPEVHGERVLSEIKGDPALGDLQVVVLLGSEAEADVILPDEVEPDSFITKPVTAENYETAVRAVTA
jgi:two-component system response regulator